MWRIRLTIKALKFYRELYPGVGRRSYTYIIPCGAAPYIKPRGVVKREVLIGRTCIAIDASPGRLDDGASNETLKHYHKLYHELYQHAYAATV